MCETSSLLAFAVDGGALVRMKLRILNANAIVGKPNTVQMVHIHADFPLLVFRNFSFRMPLNTLNARPLRTVVFVVPISLG